MAKLVTPLNDMARNSVSNGQNTVDKTVRILNDLGFTCTTKQKFSTFACPYGGSRVVRADIRVSAPEDFVIECKSNGEALGTMYGKLWYTVDLYNAIGYPTVIVLDTPNEVIKTVFLDRLRGISGPNVTWVLIEDLVKWATQRLKAASQTETARTGTL
jgi:hypothetical protein